MGKQRSLFYNETPGWRRKNSQRETHKRKAHFSLGLLECQMHRPDRHQSHMGKHFSIKMCHEGCEKLWTVTDTRCLSQPQLPNRGKSFFPWVMTGTWIPACSLELRTLSKHHCWWPCLDFRWPCTCRGANYMSPNGSWERNKGLWVAVLESVNS